MLSISIPDASNSSSPVSLGGEIYDFRFNFNDIDSVYRLDIYFQQKLIVGSIDLKTGSLLTDKYNLPDFSHGELFLAKVKATELPPSRNNVGVNKDYELIYVTNEELGR